MNSWDWRRSTFKSPDTAALTSGAFTASLCPNNTAHLSFEKAVAQLLAIAPDSEVMRQLEWLGLFSEERTFATSRYACEIMCATLLLQWQLQTTTAIW
ncbi:MAG: hypothetical protein IPL35_15015 [Sphingobacteriales bacterium]|nr:hypothetical protein [Sphingobacteriales bacterium]